MVRNAWEAHISLPGDGSRSRASGNRIRQRAPEPEVGRVFALQKDLETRPKFRHVKTKSVQSVLATIKETDLAARLRRSLSSAYSPGG